MALMTPDTDAPFSPGQRAWLDGFFAGLAAARREDGAGGATTTLTLDVLYGSQTGSCELLAEDLVAAARARGMAPTLRSLDEVTVDELPNAERVLVITSTYGGGEMPDNAALFWDEFAAETAPRLEGVSFAVLALGDTAYDDFCQAGKLIDLRFEQLGATRLLPRVDCDVRYEDPAAAWTEQILTLLAAQAPSAAAGPAPAAPAPTRERSRWNRKTPFPSALVVNRLLSGPDSAKEIRHFELALGDSGIAYQAGDAVAVVPINDPALAGLLLERLGHDPATPVGDATLGAQLERGWEIATPSKDLLALLAERAPHSELGELFVREERDAFDAWLWGKDTLDLLQLLPEVALDADDLARVFRPLQHRAYSISSSPLHSPDRIHLTLAAVRHGRPRVHHGVCSTFLADRADDCEFGIFPQPNTAFRLPADDSAPVIMIGPGTGIAPFRAFLQERAARGASGRNWLFFGDQHRASDFIYADEIEDYLARGVLTRLDLARPGREDLRPDQDARAGVRAVRVAPGRRLSVRLRRRVADGARRRPRAGRTDRGAARPRRRRRGRVRRDAQAGQAIPEGRVLR